MKRQPASLAILATLGLLGTACNLGGSLTIEGSDEPGVDGPGADKPHNGVDDGPVDGDDLENVVETREIEVGRVTLHRLNRTEYNNTVRDLLGDETRPADNFPDDDFGYGFNNIADVLSLSPLHVEMYQQTAEALVDTALAGGAIEAQTQRFEAETVGGSAGNANGDGWNLNSNGQIETVVNFTAEGTYTLRARARQQAGGPDDAIMSITVDGQPAETFTVSQTALTLFETTTIIPEGGHSIGVTFENDFYDPAAGLDRNLVVDWFEVEGPAGATGMPSPTRASIMTCDPAVAGETECATEIVTAFGKRAWRRPLEADEVTRLLALVDLARTQGDDFETGIRLALQAILVSPNFIFRVETDPDPAAAEPHPLSDYELATRLSYFLWSTMPDAELMQLADEGRLQEEAVLVEQVARMLDDPRAIALVDNYATQWLFIDVILTHTPDPTLFPSFNAELAASMRSETRMFVEELLAKNHGIDQLLVADFTYIDQNLAEHYELPAPTAEGFSRVTLEGDGRRGILGHGGLLTSLSFPARTSPVKRGAWVLGNMLCSEPPPPPPGVENLPVETTSGMTLREQMEAHSTDPSCSACHKMMDPIGFGMENYDAIGAWRDMDNGAPVDSSGTMPDGTDFIGTAELATYLAGNAKFTFCATEKMLTYALGRGVEHWDEPQMELLLERLGEDFGFRDLISEIVLSPAFRMRRGGELPESQ